MRVAIARRPAYTRTCAQCGTTWHVPRSARRWRSRLASRFLAGLAVITGGLVEADPAAIARMRRATVARNATPLHRDHGVSWARPGIWLHVNQQDQQAIDDLFRHLYR